MIDQTWLVPRLEARHSSSQVYTIHPNETDHKKWPVLKPGHYVYDFELSFNEPLPETFNVGGCKLNYHIQAIASSGLRQQVSPKQEVTVVHCPHDDVYLHDSNQVTLSRIWNRQIMYNVELADKGAAIGGNIPISVRIGCSEIRYLAVQVYLAQKIRFPGIPGRQSQLRKKLLLKSKCSDLSTGKFSETPSLNLDRESNLIIIAGSVPLLDEPNTQLKLHPDVNFTKVTASHTILVRSLFSLVFAHVANKIVVSHRHHYTKSQRQQKKHCLSTYCRNTIPCPLVTDAFVRLLGPPILGIS